MATRGKMIALSSAGMGALVLLVGAVVLREPLLEEWHLHKLRTGSAEEARRAGEALGKMGSVRAVPALLEAPVGRLRTLLPRAATMPTWWSSERVGPSPRLVFPEEPLGDAELSFLTSEQPATIHFDDATSASLTVLCSDPRAVVEVVLWASTALDEIGERAVPALERAAADERLDSGTRAFARLQLARRARASPRIVLGGESAEVSLDQRTSVPLPGSRGSVYLSAGDVTGGRVKVWVTPSTGAPLVDEKLLAEGEEVSFALGGRSFILRLEDLQTRLIGTDRALFRLREGRE